MEQLSFLHVYHHLTIFMFYWVNANIGYDGEKRKTTPNPVSRTLPFILVLPPSHPCLRPSETSQPRIKACAGVGAATLWRCAWRQRQLQRWTASTS